MKNIKYISVIVLTLVLVCFTSCQLAEDIDDFEPLFSLPAETAISDETSAELALAGMYAILQQNDGSGTPQYSIIGSTLSGVSSGGFFATGAEDISLLNNDPISTGSGLRAMYTGKYVMVNRANWVIEGVEKLTDADFLTPGRRDEIIGEAKTMRALGHFYLLRLFGQFYDSNSQYGVVVQTTPAKEAAAKPRSSVADTYAAILQDLDDAIASAPTLRAKYFANKTFAKGLKAKVLLYKGEYSQTASIAKDVIDNSGSNFTLTGTFEELFDHSSINTLSNTEALMDVYSDLNEGLGNGNFWDGLFANVSNVYYNLGQNGSVTIDGQVIKYDDTRIPFMMLGTPIIPGLVNGNLKFKQRAGPHYETVYHLRMAEVYLIYAEAAARAANSVTSDALAALNAIRTRAGATTTGGDGFETYPATITYPEFLEAVRIEKLMELATEIGEDWYDLVRYDFADGFGSGFSVEANDLKSTPIPSTDKYIMPIPDASIIAGGGVVEQNPSY
ncbi:MAG TPA: RagB/SusD family nutrient uptake outer membrane protein [Flavobacteriaceae bacterium]